MQFTLHKIKNLTIQTAFIFAAFPLNIWAEKTQSVYRLATGRTVRADFPYPYSPTLGSTQPPV
jgi:hypothetical protein